MKVRLVWFDSFGAKSSCTLVKTKDLTVLIDPGIAIMHSSFPASLVKKIYWMEKGKREIMRASREVDAIVISHYHWDHFMPQELEIYKNKTVFAKNPNEYINDSQRQRAVEFYTKLWKIYGKRDVKFERQKKKKFEDPASRLRSIQKNFGDYQKRREEVLAKGKKWFLRRVKKWKNYKVIPEVSFRQLKIVFPEGSRFRIGKTIISFTGPRFHGIEYSRVGWVFSTVIQEGGKKFVHTSDLNGPIIEDYADWLIKQRPDFIVLDGPMTYMLGYTLNLINLRRVIENVKRIVAKVDFKVLIWDHHLPRERFFREHTKEVWVLAKKLKKKVMTASEYQLNKKPVVETIRK